MYKWAGDAGIEDIFLPPTGNPVWGEPFFSLRLIESSSRTGQRQRVRPEIEALWSFTFKSHAPWPRLSPLSTEWKNCYSRVEFSVMEKDWSAVLEGFWLADRKDICWRRAWETAAGSFMLNLAYRKINKGERGKILFIKVRPFMEMCLFTVLLIIRWKDSHVCMLNKEMESRGI